MHLLSWHASDLQRGSSGVMCAGNTSMTTGCLRTIALCLRQRSRILASRLQHSL
jgi:hypothetical protein